MWEIPEAPSYGTKAGYPPLLGVGVVIPVHQGLLRPVLEAWRSDKKMPKEGSFRAWIAWEKAAVLTSRHLFPLLTSRPQV